MADNKINSANFLPEYLRTTKNTKFLSATLDQWAQPAQLERIDGYIGSKNTPNYNSTGDVYIAESSALRSEYQLTPALVVNNALLEVQDVIALDDLINEINLKGGNTTNLDRLLRSEFYSYNPYIDWDKLVNYREYYWLVMGPDEIDVIENEDQINTLIQGQTNYTSTLTGITLTNGLKLRFVNTASGTYYNNDYFVEGVGTGIRLVNFADLKTPEAIAGIYNDPFGTPEFDLFKFDNFETLPLTPEYITINRASQDLNSWSRYNRWVHADVIRITAESKNQLPVYPGVYRAQRPIIEFAADIKLYNHGTQGIAPIDFIDNTITDPTIIDGTVGYYIDEVLLQKGNKIVFNAATDVDQRSRIYKVNYNKTTKKYSISESSTVDTGSVVTIVRGVDNHGTDWHFDGNYWHLAQQHTTINQAPLFDLFFTSDGTNYTSYADKSSASFASNFTGNKIFGYAVGTGANDSVLGFPLKYRNTVEQGDYLFNNYFMTDIISVTAGTQYVSTVSTAITYFKFANIESGDRYTNVWTSAATHQIPVLQFQTTLTATNSLAITSIDSPISAGLDYEVYINAQQIPKTSTFTSTDTGVYLINFENTLTANTDVLFEVFTDAPANSNGYYQTPLSLTNNPLNGPISTFTLSELSDHVLSMTERLHNFQGQFFGINNLRDLPNTSQYGTRLISNAIPESFAHIFIGKKEHSVIDAISRVQNQYSQFKTQILAQLNLLTNQKDPVASLDLVLATINQDKTTDSSYYLSDMIAYGTDKTVTTYTVSDNRVNSYAISSEFSTTKLSLRSVLVYVNGIQLVLNQNYTFDIGDSYVTITSIIDNGVDRPGLRIGDVITIVDYPDNTGCYVPPTPTKLGLYPAFQPKIYTDTTYSTPQTVIQGHDGSITIAYNDFRDDVLLEFEKRIYNNIKQQYRSELFDVNSIMPGAFRNSQYSIKEINDILSSDFLKWAGVNGVDYTTNDIFDPSNTRTWNYVGGYIPQIDQHVSGYWRGIFKYLYDTDRPHIAPWEMLGFTEMPAWWINEYGGAPYQSTNTQLWEDIEQGLIRHGNLAGVNAFYARPGLIENNFIPVDSNGNLIDLSASLVTNITLFNQRQPWKFGDQAPAETAWRRSSDWPFAVQKLLALTKPAAYAALMYDPSRVNKNAANQWVYGSTQIFLNPKNVAIHDENGTLTSGYSVLVSEAGTQRSQNYITLLRSDLSYINFNLLYKVGGFINKNKLQIIIDAYEPTSNSPGALLPSEDYVLKLKVNNPISSASISGIIIQKTENGTFTIKGYDTHRSYFTVYTPIRSNNSPTITVGGISESYVTWTENNTGGGTGLSATDTTTAASATGLFYQAGQIVYNNGTYYRVTVSHRGENVFNPAFYQSLPELPVAGGASAQIATAFNNTPIEVPYGTEFSRIQQVYDFIVGYGAWLEDQGFVFDEFHNDINDIINWEFSGKEFLYWTTQNWATNNIITLSPFAGQIKYSHPTAVVDNLFNNFYDYSLLSASGAPFPREQIDINRQDGVCTITTTPGTDGLYFARLHAIQQEHAMVFNNTTIFNDVIYDIETGYQQQRMKISGFRTKNWNGDFFSPGFVYDNVSINDWTPFTYYQSAAVVFYNGTYYSALTNIEPAATFDFSQWFALKEAPQGGLLPNFDYQINQFQDFYSLDIDNFDSGQQRAAQHLIGYTPRVYLNNIFTNPIAQYKFYQGFIREKGTRNAVNQLSKATIQNYQGTLDYTEEWAFRVGAYGSYSSFKEVESVLVEGTFLENPQIIQYVNEKPNNNSLIYYTTSSSMMIVPDNYDPSKTFYTTTGTYKENSYILPTAGYVRIDDVTLVAYNENSLLDIANNSALKNGNTAWVGFKQTGDWDVLRYTVASFSVVSAAIGDYGSEIIFTTDTEHDLETEEIISLTQFTSQLNGVYVVKAVVSRNKFSVSTSLTTLDALAMPGPGQLFKFVTARASSFDMLPDDKDLLRLPISSLVWVDSDQTGQWTVYNKAKKYSPINLTSGLSFTTPINEQLGYSISRLGSDNLYMAGAPRLENYILVNGENRPFEYGGVTLYSKFNDISSPRFKYFVNQNERTPYYNTATSKFTNLGHSVAYDDHVFPGTNNGLLFAGAPITSHIRTVNSVNFINTATISSTVNYSNYVEQGLVTISSIDPVSNEETREVTLVSPYPQSYEHFGSSLYVQLNTSSKLLLVGASGAVDSVGTVYAYRLGYNTFSTAKTIKEYKLGNRTTSTVTTVKLNYINSLTATSSTIGMQWGHSISGSDDGTVIAIGAPGYNDRTGLVEIFNGTSTVQTIHSPFDIGGGFGKKVEVSSNGGYLIISAPDVYSYSTNNNAYGQVAIYTATAQGFVLDSVLKNPAANSALRFGHDISINKDTNILVVSALGTDLISTAFDQVQTRTIGGRTVELSTGTINDAGTTEFYTTVENTGNVYIFNRLKDRFVLAEELTPPNPFDGGDHGHSVKIDRENTIFVGAPAIDNSTTSSFFYQYITTATSAFSWDTYRSQEDLVEIDAVQRVTLIDTYNESVLSYLEIIDPAKGKISGIADQEIKYKSMFDPATYTIGSIGTVVNPNTNWLDDHVGELWWDLSTVKYQWYEQGDLEHRKNNWGQLFPGSSIDVYEWVGSYLLPSQWAAQADTVAGLTQGISGQPKFINDSTVSAKQTYDPISDSFTNYYFFWVKNKIIVPTKRNRKISAYQVASVIADPVAYGLQFAAPISSDAVALANIGSVPVGSRIDLNIVIDHNPTNIPKHTEWLLLQENSAESMPPPVLEKKLLDSLIGHDSLGNLVPDPSLSPRQRYGIDIRPRQGIFVNRFEALRNLLDFTNNILINVPVTGNYSFINFEKQELIPDEYQNAYDEIVETVDSLSIIDVRQLTAATAAVLTATVYNGQVISVDIVNPGYGYKSAPAISIIGSSSSPAVITTKINDLGAIIDFTIVSPGAGYAVVPELVVRPYTVIVLDDALANHKWSKFVWDAYNLRWSRAHTQKYNTPLYWNYVDYSSTDYNQYKLLDYTVDSTYELQTLVDAKVGDYIKIKNIGDGRSAIVSPAASGSFGTFSSNYDLIWSQNGTIQLSNSLWDIPASKLGFDEFNNFDQTLYNQAPDLELQYILAAIKNDIFIDELKINWNKFFFTAVKYCLYEQKLLDWAFKTTFINVINYAGGLDQRPVYKITTSSYFEQYIEEVKPYHTQIRNFITNQTTLDTVGSYNTDFDLPSYYNATDNTFETISTTSTLIDSYPWKSWSDNYAYSVGSVLITNGGVGYTETPTIIISPPDLDSGTTATVMAYIGARQISSIKITNPGSGYVNTPTATIVGGGTVTTTATVYVQLVNDKVRKNTIDIKFDRISRQLQIGNINVVDSFVADGSLNEFVLSWVAQPNKQQITVTLDNDLVLITDYTIKNYTDEYNGYMKKYSKLVFLNYIPGDDAVVTIEYVKSTDLMSAIERIDQFTGISDASTVTSGLTYPETTLLGVSFDHTSAWSEAYPAYDTFAWADAVSDYVSVKVATTSSDSTIHLTTTTGIMVGQYANVTTYAFNVFNTSTVRVASINTTASTVTLDANKRNVPAEPYFAPNHELSPGDTIEFWSNDDNFGIIDANISGGAWDVSTSSYFMDAIGIDPADVAVDPTTGLYWLGGISTASNNIIVDGDGYYTPDTGFSPEELMAGQATESVGINVYTKDLTGSALVISSYVTTVVNTSTVVPLTIPPANVDSITVNFNNIFFVYNTNTNWTNSSEFTIDWSNTVTTLIIPPQTVEGILQYTIITVGGDQYVNTDYRLAIDMPSVHLESTADFAATINSVYVTVDGVSLSTATSFTGPYYELTYADKLNHRAVVDVYNIPEGEHLAQAWFFGSKYKHFAEINEQIFTIDNNIGNMNFILSQPPGNIGPFESNMIVETTDLGNLTRQLVGPYVSYYQITNSLTFNIQNNVAPENFASYINADPFDFVKVYKNGLELAYGYDFYIPVVEGTNNLNGTVALVPGVASYGDAIAVVSYFQQFSPYEYSVNGNTLTIIPQLQSGGKIRAITFTNHDDLLMRTERFENNSLGRYKLSAPVANNNYIWVSIGGSPLFNNIDFTILNDRLTVQVASKFNISQENFQHVIITSISTAKLAPTVLGYRIFNDMFNRTQFKRLSKLNTTVLTQPLNFYDTEIHVENSGALSQPFVSRKIPGVVIISGERIEFYQVEGNVLKQLRRNTLGTAPCFYNDIGTKVIDQGIHQTIPYSENIYKQSYINVGTTNTYVISTASTMVYYDKVLSLITNSTSTTLTSLTPYDNIDSVYVTVNGVPAIEITTATSSTYIASLIPDAGENIYIVGQGNPILVPPTSTELPHSYLVKAGLNNTVSVNVAGLSSSSSYVVEAWVIGSGSPSAAKVPFLSHNDGINFYSNVIASSAVTFDTNLTATNTTATISIPKTFSNTATVTFTTGTFTWTNTPPQILNHYPITTATTSTRVFDIGVGIVAENTNTVVLRNGKALTVDYDFYISNAATTATVVLVPELSLFNDDNIDVIFYTSSTVAPIPAIASLDTTAIYYNDTNFTYRVQGNTATIVVITATTYTTTSNYISTTDWSTSTNARQFTVDLNNNLVIPPQSNPTIVNYSDSLTTYSDYLSPINQVSVYYGGRLLRKTGDFRLDTTVSYDGPMISYTTATVATATDLPNTTVIGTAYIALDTNQVWVYARSTALGSINGYVYQGLDYLPPEFSINSLTQEITLNIPEALESHLPVRLDIVKRDFSAKEVWNDLTTTSNTVSIMESTSTQARFLQDQPAELPDWYYYGGNKELIDLTGFAITTNDNDPLEGY